MMQPSVGIRIFEDDDYGKNIDNLIQVDSIEGAVQVRPQMVPLLTFTNLSRCLKV